MDLHQKLEEVSRQFRIEGEYVGYETIQTGNVNHTYRVKFIKPTGEPKSYLVQNVNTYAFRDPVALMDNIDKVTEHIRAKRPGQLALHFHHTADRKTYVMDGKNFWRMMNFIYAMTFDSIEDLGVIRNAGKAFGEFQNQLSDFDITQLHETIPNFHNTRARYENLLASVKANAAGRLEEVREEIEWLLSVQDQACTLTDMLNAGQLPLRVTHNDTKLNNVLLDPETHAPLCVLDLDTVMPGLSAYDFGDSIRTGAATVAEDDQDTSKMKLDLHLFEIFTRGFMNGAPSLTEAEVKALPLGAFVMTLECGVRFLKDYLDGDIYFRTGYPTHNLVRCRTQMDLCIDMLAHWAEMEAIVETVAKEIR